MGLKQELWGEVALQVFTFVAVVAQASGAGNNVTSISQSAPSVRAHGFVDLTLNVVSPPVNNPFTKVMVAGEFGMGGSSSVKTNESCDSPDRTVYQVRTMPSRSGESIYSVANHAVDEDRHCASTSRRPDGRRHGSLHIDPAYPWHSICESAHESPNDNTASLINSFRDENVVHAGPDRQHKYKVNRLRIIPPAQIPRSFWGELVISHENRVCGLNPWLAQRPNNPWNPRLDGPPFNIPYSHKSERDLGRAGDGGIVVSVAANLGNSAAKPGAPGGHDKCTLHYAAEPLGAFSNVTWLVLHICRIDESGSIRGAWLHAPAPASNSLRSSNDRPPRLENPCFEAAEDPSLPIMVTLRFRLNLQMVVVELQPHIRKLS